VTADIDALVHRMRPAGAEPEGALVLLHGRGTDELDLLPVADRLDPERRLAVVAPRAPLSLAPGGYHWYIVRRVGFPDERTFFDSLGRLAEWLDALPRALGVPWERTFLGGFSMGAVMSYALGLGAGRPAPAGIVALSGFIPTVEGFEVDLRHRQGLAVAIGHGTEDPIISVDFAREARRRLEEAGLAVLYRESAMPHTIDPRFVAQLRDWLKDRLVEPRSREP
jgi:phospholipase/carboxylesterase